jgi:predicted TIM-barrel fold metal-dependent hydrolase
VPPNEIVEPILEPDLPIVDAHHHLWFRSPTAAVPKQDMPPADRALVSIFKRHSRYLFDELLGDLQSGHNIRKTVYAEARAMFRTTGPKELRSVGEIEFANGIAAMAASGVFGDILACAGIIGGGVDLTMGNAVAEVLEAHLRAGGSRYRGLRCMGVYDEDPVVMRNAPGVPHILLDPRFRQGFRHLHRYGLSCDIWVFEPQLPDVTDLAHAFPETAIILNHTCGPLGIGRYAGRREERLPIWRHNMRMLAECPNVTIKLGGLGTPAFGFPSTFSEEPASSIQLAEEWRPYIGTCIETFGADRCMFETNYPVDSTASTYPIVWNAFKRIASGASPAEKEALFSGTATRVYRLEEPSA